MNDTTTPTYRPALPGEVMEIIKSTLWYSMPSAQVLEATERVCAALAPHWRRMEEHIASCKEVSDDFCARAEKAEAEVERLTGEVKAADNRAGRFYTQQIADLREKLAAAEASLAAARRDGERLDWLSKPFASDHSGRWELLWSEDLTRDIRAAIDAARAISSANGSAQRSTQGGKEGQ